VKVSGEPGRLGLVGDQRLRDLERRWRTSGDPADEAAWLEVRARAGLTPRFDSELVLRVWCRDDVIGEERELGWTPSRDGRGVLIPECAVWGVQAGVPSLAHLDAVLQVVAAQDVPGLTFSSSQHFSEPWLERIAERAPHLEWLELSLPIGYDWLMLTHLRRLRLLRGLSLSDRGLGELDPSIELLTGLESLCLGSVAGDYAGPFHEVASLHGLQRLELARCHPARLPPAPLRSLCLWKFKAGDLAVIASRYADLEELLLANGDRLTPDDLAALGRLSRLRRLELSHDADAPGALEAIARLPSLRVLRYHRSDLSPASLGPLRGVEHLESLELFTLTPGAAPAWLASLPGLQRLHLVNFEFGADFFEAASRAPGLRELTLQAAGQAVGIDGLANDRLRRIGIAASEDLEVGPLVAAAVACRGLEAFSTTASCSDHDLEALASACPDLTSLACGGSLGDRALRAAAGLGALRELNLRAGPAFDGFTDAGLAHLSRLSDLRTLSLGGARSVTDGGLGHLAGLARLRELSLDAAWGRISVAGLPAVAGLTHLAKLRLGQGDVMYRPGIPHDELGRLFPHCLR
jgi:hypothetical protein